MLACTVQSVARILAAAGDSRSRLVTIDGGSARGESSIGATVMSFE